MKKTPIWITGLLLFLAGTGAAGQDPEPIEIGKPAPGFELKGTDGKVYSLESFRNAKVLVVVFMANHCPTAQAYGEKLNRMSSSYSPDQVQLVAVSSNHPDAVCPEEHGYTDLGDTFEDMKIRADQRGFKFPYLFDGETQEVAMACGAVATPHAFIFDGDRKLRYRGRIDDTEDPYREPGQQDAKNAIEAILQGEPVPVETTPAFGCSMKWKSKMEWCNKLGRDWAARPVELAEIDLAGIKEMLENPGKNLRLINVWATWCGPCVIEFPEFVEMQRMYGQRDFEVISLSVDKPGRSERALKFLEEKEAAFTNYIYSGDDVYELMEAVAPDWEGNIPYTLLVAPGGEVIYRHDGIIDPLEVRKTIIGQLGRYYADDK
jgi:peroxiredoxin